MSNPLQPAPFAGRPRVVALVVGVSAIGMAVLLVAVSLVLRVTVSNDVRDAVQQEAGEVQRFAQTGVDPSTGQGFASGTRFTEVYLERQQAEDAELIVGGTVGAPGVIEQAGTDAPSFAQLDEATQRKIQEPGSSGTTSVRGMGTVSWRNVEIQAPQDTGYVAVVAFHEAAERETRVQLLALMGLAALALLATGLAAWWVAGPILDHTRRFREAVDAAVERRGVPVLPEEGGSEYVELARSANRLVARAEQTVERERQYAEDITHELRTPLAVLEGGLDQPGQTPEQAEYMRERLLGEVRRLRLLVTDLVTLHRADRPDYVRPLVVVDAAAVADEAVAVWEDRLEAEGEGADGVRVVLGECEPGLPVSIDPPRLQQALDALVANARKASEPGSWVTVGVRRLEEPDGRVRVGIEVVDAGRGIPPEERATMVRRFARASNDPAPGAGTGLALADRLAIAHRGRLRIEDHGEYPGMTVSIDLPVAGGAGDREDADDAVR